MASSLPSYFCASIKLPLKRSSYQGVKIRAQSFREEDLTGRSSKIVDENLSVLRKRMVDMKMKERLERCCRCENGWNYAAGYNYKRKKEEDLLQLFEVVGLVCGTFGVTCICGTLCLCLASLLVHLIQ